jgi:putative oxidoreductase
MDLDVGLLILRLVLAALLAGHATQKLFGWFRGKGIVGTAAAFENWGFLPGKPLVILAGTGELIGAAMLGFGVLVPLGSAIIAGTMIVAISPNFAKGIWAHLGGFEVPFIFAALAICLAVTGPGAVSLDQLLGLNLYGVGWATIACCGALAMAVPPLLSRNRNLATRSAGN